VHIPIHELPRRLGEVPAGAVWVHCAAGTRAGIAAGLLDRDGRSVVSVDDDFANAAKSDLEVTTPTA
jgi:rhodanese-related sulfurtransferase